MRNEERKLVVGAGDCGIARSQWKTERLEEEIA
jgi:hypothetical protein